jgi:integrase
MAKPILRGGKWYVKVKDETGRWKRKVTAARTRKDAERFQADLQMQVSRRTEGLEPLQTKTSMTLGQLLEWWLATYSARMPSHEKNVSAVRKHIVGDKDLAELPLRAVSPGRIETFLQAKAGSLGPQSINHLRNFVGRAFNAARSADLWVGENPARNVKKRRVARRAPDYLRFDEVPLVLGALSARWRAMFATAIFAGLRKGELRALRKADVDFPSGLLRVARSGERDTTKGGHGDYIPINKELVPFLKAAIAASPSELLFPGPDGKMMSARTGFEKVLRRAMARAGIVTGFEHVCRRKGCGLVENAADDRERRCAKCSFLLWCRPLVRKIRFHDLRHTTASLSLMSGAGLVAVQALLRHTDPKTTMAIYGHLADKFLRREVEKLSFGDALSSARAGVSTESKEFGPPVVQTRDPGTKKAGVLDESARDLRPFGERAIQDSNLWPSAPELRAAIMHPHERVRKLPQFLRRRSTVVRTERIRSHRIPESLLPRLLPVFGSRGRTPRPRPTRPRTGCF